MVAISASASKDVDSGALELPEYALALVLPGRHGTGQVDALFEKSGLFSEGFVLKHNPYLAYVFDPATRRLAVQVITNTADLSVLPPETPVMAQWPGQWRSDWFHFTVSEWIDYRRRLEDRLERSGGV